jgi:hypothetical protein
VFEHAALVHGDTETGPGHTCYGTGLNPTHTGSSPTSGCRSTPSASSTVFPTSSRTP